MNKINGETRKTVQDSTEYQMGSRHGSVEGKTKQVIKKIGFEALASHDIDRVEKNGEPELFDSFEYRKKIRIGKVSPIYVSSQIHAANSRQPGGPFQFLYGKTGILQGKKGKAYK
jgi:hypothetical protein